MTPFTYKVGVKKRKNEVQVIIELIKVLVIQVAIDLYKFALNKWRKNHEKKIQDESEKVKKDVRKKRRQDP